MPPPVTEDPSGRATHTDELVVRAQAGDGEAFAELYERYVDLVLRYTRYRVGDLATAEDMTSETFLRAWRRIGSYTFQGLDLGAWLLTIAKNIVIDHYRSAAQRLTVLTDDVGLTARLAPAEGPDAQVLAGFESRRLFTAIRELTPEQQECIVLRFLHELPLAETAAVMGRTVDAVKQLQRRAVKQLEKRLERGDL